MKKDTIQLIIILIVLAAVVVGILVYMPHDILTIYNWYKENLTYGGFTHVINDSWSWSFFVRYDLRVNELDEIGGYIQYQLDCLAFQLRTSYLKGYDRIDGSERDNDFRVSFMMWLRAQQKEPTDEWLRW